MDQPSKVPGPVVRRASLYLRQLEALDAKRVASVSSGKLAQALGLGDAQVRKDLAHFGQFGVPGVGYEVMALIQSLRSIFGIDRITRALLVGAGSLGTTVAAYQGFRAKGFELVAVLDSDPEKIGQRFGDLTVQPMTVLPEAARRHGVRLAIIAVPAAAAQLVADQLVGVGIRGILNFAPVRLETPTGVTVRNIDVAAELVQLSFAISAESPRDPDQKEVLIVDDNEATVVFLSEIVEDNGHRPRVARNGAEASFAIAERRPDISA